MEERVNSEDIKDTLNMIREMRDHGYNPSEAQLVIENIGQDLLDARAERDALKAKLEKAIKGIQRLYTHTVTILESGRDRIVFLGGSCDDVETMEKQDSVLSEIRELVAAINEGVKG